MKAISDILDMPLAHLSGIKQVCTFMHILYIQLNFTFCLKIMDNLCYYMTYFVLNELEI